MYQRKTRIFLYIFNIAIKNLSKVGLELAFTGSPISTALVTAMDNSNQTLLFQFSSTDAWASSRLRNRTGWDGMGWDEMGWDRMG